MASLKYLFMLVTGLLGFTCYESKTLTATDSQQTIETYGYSSWLSYSNYMFEKWSIETKDPMYTVEVEIDMDIESCWNCVCDSLQIYDGSNTGATSLGKFCGTSTGKSISSSGREMYVVFKSDSTVQRRGFKLKYKQVSDESGIWIIVGVVLAVVFIIASVCLIVCVCCKCKTKDQVVPIHLNHQYYHQPQVWVTPVQGQHLQAVPLQIPPPLMHQEVPERNTQTTEMHDMDNGDLPEEFHLVGVGSRPPRQYPMI